MFHAPSEALINGVAKEEEAPLKLVNGAINGAHAPSSEYNEKTYVGYRRRHGANATPCTMLYAIGVALTVAFFPCACDALSYDGYQDIIEANSASTRKEELEAMRRARQANRSGLSSIDESKSD